MPRPQARPRRENAKHHLPGEEAKWAELGRQNLRGFLDWRSVKMGYGSLQHPELYDAIYLHTHPRGKRIIPDSVPDYVHAETFKIVSTLLIGNGISIEFESVEKSGNGVDQFEIDGRRFSLKRPRRSVFDQRSNGGVAGAMLTMPCESWIASSEKM
jgi:hypothetical protein